ncbi:MAG: hypothetical protein NT062_24420 [Proteobacteria bacterium]|nr:hypothetical protein [Pseudomonadota bacterium]
MGLPAAPKVEVHLPPVVVVGRPCAIVIAIVAQAETNIDFIDARVRGHLTWVIGAGKTKVRHTVTYPDFALQLTGPGVLPAGSTTYRTTFTLPPDTAPTHAHRFVQARCELGVHVSIPWWPDGRYHFVVPVRVPPPASVLRQPILAQQTSGKARLELSLASNRLVVGETLVGSFALFHVDDDKPRELEIALVPNFTLWGRGRFHQRAGQAQRYVTHMPAGAAGKTVPFALVLPVELTPTFATVTHKLDWMLVVKHGSLFGPSVAVTVPIELYDRAAQQTAPRLAIPPQVADARIVATFASVARANGWRLTDGPSIEADVGGCVLSLAYLYEGATGEAIVAQLAHPSLGLGLVVTPGSAVRHAFFHDLEVDVAAWDRDHHVIARSEVQALPFLKQVVPALQRVAGATFVHWDDDAIVFHRPIAAIEASDLTALGDAVAPLAHAIEAATNLIAPPIATDLDAWRALARAVDGTLVVGDLMIVGEEASIALRWDAMQRPIGVRVTAGDPERASELLRAVAIDLPAPALDAGLGSLPDGVADLLAAWPLDVANLHVGGGVASAELSAIAPDRARELLAQLRALLALLDPGAGPYR